jgi:hypothetical protein
MSQNSFTKICALVLLGSFRVFVKCLKRRAKSAHIGVQTARDEHSIHIRGQKKKRKGTVRNLRIPMANVDSISELKRFRARFRVRSMISQARCGKLYFNMNFKADMRTFVSFSQLAGSVLGKKNPESKTETTVCRTTGHDKPDAAIFT